MNSVQRTLARISLTTALLVPSFAVATTCKEYEKAGNDRAKQSQLFKDAYAGAVARTLAALRDTHFKDGKVKTVQRIDRDLARADRIESMAGHLTVKQADNLVNMIAEYADAKPDTNLEDVISSFLLTEADKPAAKTIPGTQN